MGVCDVSMFSPFAKKTIFISYAREYKAKAEEIAYTLRTRDYTVFFDLTNLQPGQGYDDKLRSGVQGCDVFIFLISPESVKSGSYALTELSFAESKWPNPIGRILPVEVAPTRMEHVPRYLSVVQFLRPRGNLAAEVLNEVERMSGGSGSLEGVRLPSMPALPSMFGQKTRKIFISHSRSDMAQADELARTLSMQGHEVQWQGASMPGQSYEMMVQNKIRSADTFIFLISPSSVRTGSRALGELALAQTRWPSPGNNVIPVAIAATQRGEIPSYLRANIFEPKGNLGFEVMAELARRSGRQVPGYLVWIMGILGLLAGLLTLQSVESFYAYNYAGRSYSADEGSVAMVILGILVGAIVGLGIQLSGRYSLRQAVSAGGTIALGAILGALIAWSDVKIGEPAYQWVVGLLSGGVFGLIAQLALASSAPGLLSRRAWLLMPLSAGATWALILSSPSWGSIVWVAWPVAFAAVVGYRLREGRRGRSR